ncbi:Crp/Fnr family transcriptional regulator [Variovorax sp. HJSM1_2]|uniref:Crp/Fnr family transcriptional regulator n=1 Tax=Variovorax sp. HJSM1_2 TaxID=3366263 RepID=UPI003BD7B581
MFQAENHLVELLPRKDRQRLLSVCEQVELTLGQVLCESGAYMRHVYFPNNCCISLVSAIDGRAGLEVGMVGREGMIGAHLVFGVSIAPLHAVVTGAGRALRLDCSIFRTELIRSAALQHTLGRYTYVIFSQSASSMGCQRFHLLGARLARWLLMRHDQAQSDSFLATHEGLGHVLGVRRVGVTLAAGVLQSKGFIAYSRGMLTVLDRGGLEGVACSCYARDRSIYDQFLQAKQAQLSTKTHVERGLRAAHKSVG